MSPTILKHEGHSFWKKIEERERGGGFVMVMSRCEQAKEKKNRKRKKERTKNEAMMTKKEFNINETLIRRMSMINQSTSTPDMFPDVQPTATTNQSLEILSRTANDVRKKTNKVRKKKGKRKPQLEQY